MQEMMKKLESLDECGMDDEYFWEVPWYAYYFVIELEDCARVYLINPDLIRINKKNTTILCGTTPPLEN